MVSRALRLMQAKRHVSSVHLLHHLMSPAFAIAESRRQFSASTLSLVQASASTDAELHCVKSSLTTAGLGIASSIGAHSAISILQPEWVVEQAPLLFVTGLAAGVLGIACRSKQWSFGAVCIGWTSMAAPIVATVDFIDPLIWPAAVSLSSTIVGVSSLWALTKPTLGLPMHLHGAIITGLHGITLFNNIMWTLVSFQTDSVIDLGFALFIKGSNIAMFTAINVCEIQSAAQLVRRGQFNRFNCSVKVLWAFSVLTLMSVGVGFSANRETLQRKKCNGSASNNADK